MNIDQIVNDAALTATSICGADKAESLRVIIKAACEKAYGLGVDVTYLQCAKDLQEWRNAGEAPEP